MIVVNILSDAFFVFCEYLLKFPSQLDTFVVTLLNNATFAPQKWQKSDYWQLHIGSTVFDIDYVIQSTRRGFASKLNG